MSRSVPFREKNHARCVAQQQQKNARCVEQQQQKNHASVHCDCGSRAWGSGGCARCVGKQQQAAPPPMPPINGLCNSRLCVGHASVHWALRLRLPCLGVRRSCALCWKAAAEKTTRGRDDTPRAPPRRLPLCEQRSDRYYRFTLEGEAAPPPMPPINGLCNSRLCVGCVSATPPSIAIAAPVLGGPEVMRVVLESSSRKSTSVHSDRGPRAWGSGGYARCVGKQQQGHPFPRSPAD